MDGHNMFTATLRGWLESRGYPPTFLGSELIELSLVEHKRNMKKLFASAVAANNYKKIGRIRRAGKLETLYVAAVLAPEQGREMALKTMENSGQRLARGRPRKNSNSHPCEEENRTAIN